MKKILFITSQYRVGERIYPIIPKLSAMAELHLLKVYQMADSFKWTGDMDLRDVFNKNYLTYFTKVFQHTCDVSIYDLIIFDDNRNSIKTNSTKTFKDKKCPLLGCTHGNTDDFYSRDGYNVVFDKCFVFGNYDTINEHCIPIGIPSNDQLNFYQNFDKKHILIIVNFLGNRHSPFKIRFNETFFNEIDIKSIQKYCNLPVVIKLKSRADDPGYINNIEYLKRIIPKDLNYRILIDIEDDNKLIAESAAVISAPSTLAFKPIQLGIPTVLINDSGAIGCFKNYDGLLNLNDDILSYITSYTKKTEFIQNAITGGLTFNSTEIMINEIKKYI